MKVIIDSGAEIIGDAVIAAAVLLSPSPQAQITIAASRLFIVQGLRRAGEEVTKRWLGPREKIRIGETITSIAQKAKENIDKGKVYRKDWNDSAGTDGRTIRDEIIEGTLLIAQREYEERKIRFYGILTANLGFKPDIDRAHATFLLRRASQMSYRQLCLLAIFAQPEYATRNEDYLNVEMDGSLEALLLEIRELHGNDIVNIGFAPSENIRGIRPHLIKTTIIGRELFELMELWNIKSEDFREVQKLLS